MSSPALVPSGFNVSVPLDDGRVAVYNTACGALLLLAGDVWRRHLAPEAEQEAAPPPEEPPAALREHGLLVPSGFDELAAARVRFERGRWRMSELEVTVVPTLACNLRCPYCFEGGAMERPGSLTMSRAVEGHLLRWLAASLRGKERLSLTWYGGEPVLALGQIERLSGKLLPALDAMGILAGAAILTNGTRLTSDVAERLVACRVHGAQVSVDVPSRTRDDAAGRDTLGAALDGVAAAIDAGMTVALRINVLTADGEAFDRLYDELDRRDLPGRLRSADFHLVRAPESPFSQASEYPVLSLAGFEAATLRERRKALARGVPVKSLNFSRHALCQAVRDNGVIVGPSGRLYKCMEEVGLDDRSHGSVVPGTLANDANLLPWLTHDWFAPAECGDCVLQPQCAGGCPQRRIRQPGALAPEAYCFPEIKSNLRERIRLYAEQHGDRPEAGAGGATVIDAAE